MDSWKPQTAIVQQAEETEQQLIDRASRAESNSDWEIGECASVWTTKYARGRTDSDFAGLTGIDAQRIQQRRRVYETFGDLRGSYTCMKFSHFRQALGWIDAEECLAWANENEATVAGMKAYRRMIRGEDLTVEADSIPEDTNQSLVESSPSTTKPDSEPEPGVQDVDPYVPPPSNVVPTPKEKPKPEKTKAVTPEPEPREPTLLGEVNEYAKRWKPLRDLVQSDEGRSAAKVLRKMADWFDPPTPTKSNVKFLPPPVAEVAEYCRERRNNVDAEKWHDHYTANGWKVGKNTMKDWRASVRTWEKSDNGQPTGRVAFNPATEFDPANVGETF